MGALHFEFDFDFLLTAKLAIASVLKNIVCLLLVVWLECRSEENLFTPLATMVQYSTKEVQCTLRVPSVDWFF